MADLRVTPAALHAAADRLRAESARIDAALRGIESEAGALRANWDGAAQAAYDTAQLQWSATFLSMKDTLHSIAKATDGIAEDYVETDHRSAKQFR
ncbi:MULTISPECIES: WXG100 family type VII secretion target [unclassified Microbacterium]|uniref:WXG100 family type VII secretion target n=1 Tax=unclassified Microbacterium TaxID=2609290 RepID=UPI00214D0B1B|nr:MULTISPECIES: WXG100 family type VII secretion target [unclassified Microbacterium]MCR2784679.1 WXG100 family type VII secretion target [Microbacterium sp. zg.B96]MDL5352870.1 WXG100 family type VII secretion target [Microbacterium sp. zg-YB36]WIM16220.1 WXG100 family type VII secretion target [Microbacterium sp. zg-B96]